MHRYTRTIVAALALLLLVASAAFAAAGPTGLSHRAPAANSHQPDPSSEADPSEPADPSSPTDPAGPSQQLLDRIVTDFGNEGVTTDADTVAALAADYGVGGAVRILSWADAAGVDPSVITDMLDSGMGWGQIGKQLNSDYPDANVSPGIGHLMSGGTGHGNTGDHGNSANAPGHNK